jgi:uncharacterized membrane protein YfcA
MLELLGSLAAAPLGGLAAAPDSGRYAAFVGAVFASSVLSSALGVGGYALLPLFVGIYGAKSGVAVITVYFLFQNFAKLLMTWRHVDFALATRLVAWSLPGALLGGALLVVVPAHAFQRVLGAGVLAMVIVPRLRPRRPAPARPARAERAGFALFALAYGVASGALGSGNVLKGPFLTSLGVVKERYIGTYALTSCALNVPKLLVYRGSGVAPGAVLASAWPLLLVSLAGTYAGTRLLRHIPPAWFERITSAVFVVAALAMLLGPTT